MIYVLTKDFVVPQMALEDIGAMEGWRRLWAMIKAEKGGYAGYIGMKIVLAIGAGIVVGIAGFILGLIFVIPTAGLAVAAVVAGKAAGLSWNACTITLAVVAGCIVLAVFLYVMALISVPAIVFFPGVFHLLLCRALSRSERRALSRSAGPGRAPDPSPPCRLHRRTSAVAACAGADRIERGAHQAKFVIPSGARNPVLPAHGKDRLCCSPPQNHNRRTAWNSPDPQVSDVADTRVPNEKPRSFPCRSQWQAEVRAVPRLTSRR